MTLAYNIKHLYHSYIGNQTQENEMNKITTQATLEKSRNSSGIEAARLAVGAQRMALKSKYYSRFDDAFMAHVRASRIAGEIIKTGSHAEKSEAGRIIAESRFIGWQ